MHRRTANIQPWVKPSMTSVPDPHQSRPTGNTYHKKDQSPVINATTKSNSIIQRNRSAAARTEEDDGPEIGPHQATGPGAAPSLLRGRKNASIIHGDYCGSNGPAKQKEDGGEVGMWWWYKHEGGYKRCLGAIAARVARLSRDVDAFPTLATFNNFRQCTERSTDLQ